VYDLHVLRLLSLLHNLCISYAVFLLCSREVCKVCCDEYVCLCFFLSVHSHMSETTWPDFTKFCACCMLTVAMAQSSSVGTVICYELSVLWITLYFRVMGPMARHVYSYAVNSYALIRTKYCLTITTKYLGCTLGMKSALYDSSC